MSEDFTVDKVSWHTRVLGDAEPREKVVLRFGVFHKYLQEHHLLRSDLSNQHPDIDDNFAIHSRDLTEEGIAFIRAAYDKWLRKVDNGMDPRNVSIFDRALERLRQK